MRTKKTCGVYPLPVTELHRHGHGALINCLMRELESQGFQDIRWKSLNFEQEGVNRRIPFEQEVKGFYKSTLKSSQTEIAWVISRGISLKTWIRPFNGIALKLCCSEGEGAKRNPDWVSAFLPAPQAYVSTYIKHERDRFIFLTLC